MDMDMGKEKLTLSIIKKELLKNMVLDIVRLLIGFPLLAFVLWGSSQFFIKTTLYPIVTKIFVVWSAAYCMFPYELFKTSRVDDHFTLVMLDEKILMVYNDKFFDTSAIQYSE